MRSAEEKYTHQAILEILDTVQMDNMSFIVYKGYFLSIFPPLTLDHISQFLSLSPAILSASLQP